MSDLRERLRARERPSLDYELPDGDVLGAKRAVEAAEAELRHALRRLGKASTNTAPENAESASDAVEAEAAVAAAREAVAQAEEALDACYVHIKLTAMPPDEYEALKALHPPRPDSDDKEWNAATFPRACFLACATELPPEEWEPILAENLTHAEREDLYLLAEAVNTRLVNPAVPKGSRSTRSS
ncbi:hypothetical protein [Microbispora triticiradicis]|uniref:hypothetical protein n=1 Tax=Microbispora triticiradicis TaxID=2200763 RepID=UPI001AD648D2|nr:hypothetical protein [Microbispora triticiradicis]MBO4272381.1 hypothetical protein [Microbispora triticiradicis]